MAISAQQPVVWGMITQKLRSDALEHLAWGHSPERNLFLFQIVRPRLFICQAEERLAPQFQRVCQGVRCYVTVLKEH